MTHTGSTKGTVGKLGPPRPETLRSIVKVGNQHQINSTLGPATTPWLTIGRRIALPCLKRLNLTPPLVRPAWRLVRFLFGRHKILQFQTFSQPCRAITCKRHLKSLWNYLLQNTTCVHKPQLKVPNSALRLIPTAHHKVPYSKHPGHKAIT